MTTTALLERRLVVRGLLAAATPLLAAAILLLAPTIARADSGSSLTVVGTSDVSDSGLMQNVIQPRFHAAFPQYTFKYIGTATGNAINSAESGSQGASVLIVHAPSLENQFVGGGFSQEPFGRAIWINDFVLAGPTADPASVGTDGSNNIAQAFADVAKAGINSTATFVSRGGTPGTTVQEHQIWALVDSSGLAPTGLLLCALSAANGGGETPIAAGHGVTTNDQSSARTPEQPHGSPAARRRSAGVVHRDRPHPGPERRRRERVQRLPERRQQLLRVHRPRHLRLPVGRQRRGRGQQPGGHPEPEDRHARSPAATPPPAAPTR